MVYSDFLFFFFAMFKKSRLVFDSPSSLHEWKTKFFFMSSEGWEATPSENPENAPKLLRRWGTPDSGASFILLYMYLRAHVFHYKKLGFRRRFKTSLKTQKTSL